MTERPPGGGGRPPGDGGPGDGADGSDGWRALKDQVEAALDEAGVLADTTRLALLEALEEALEQLAADAGDGAHELDLDPASQPDGGEQTGAPPGVTVVDGGRSRNQPRSRKPRPELWVAPGRAPASEGGGPTDDEDAGGNSPSQVRVVRLAAPDGPRGPGLAQEGRIRLDADGRQAVYRGEQAHPYRLACTAGRLAVSVDGVTVETLSVGQSCDVVGRAVVVLAADEAPAAGAYARLP